MATTDEGSKEVRWKDKVIKIKGTGYSNEIYSRHHRSKFTYAGDDFYTVAQATAYMIAGMSGQDKAADEIMTGSGAGCTEGKWDDMGLRFLDMTNPDDAESAVYAAMLAILAKFLTTKPLFDALVSTKDGVIIDVSSNIDSFWSIGYHHSDMWQNIDKWGKNELGKILHVVRFVLIGERDRAYNDITETGDERIVELAKEAAKVYNFTADSDWNGVVGELEEEQEEEMKSKEQKL